MRKTKPNVQGRCLATLSLVEASYKDHQPGGRCYNYYITVRGTAVANDMAVKMENLWKRALNRAKVDENGRPVLELI